MLRPIFKKRKETPTYEMNGYGSRSGGGSKAYALSSRDNAPGTFGRKQEADSEEDILPIKGPMVVSISDKEADGGGVPLAKRSSTTRGPTARGIVKTVDIDMQYGKDRIDEEKENAPWRK
jgi:hypothetical protein